MASACQRVIYVRVWRCRALSWSPHSGQNLFLALQVARGAEAQQQETETGDAGAAATELEEPEEPEAQNVPIEVLLICCLSATLLPLFLAKVAAPQEAPSTSGAAAGNGVAAGAAAGKALGKKTPQRPPQDHTPPLPYGLRPRIVY